MARSPNLHLLLRTAVIATTRDPTTGAVTSLTVVTRTPVNASTEWSVPLSHSLPDWYSPVDSPVFTKTVYNLTGAVFVEATELGDVLVTSGLPFAQGMEAPDEDNFTLIDNCGQAATLTFYMTLLPTVSVPECVRVPVCVCVNARVCVSACVCAACVNVRLCVCASVCACTCSCVCVYAPPPTAGAHQPRRVPRRLPGG